MSTQEETDIIQCLPIASKQLNKQLFQITNWLDEEEQDKGIYCSLGEHQVQLIINKHPFTHVKSASQYGTTQVFLVYSNLTLVHTMEII